jgi:hypothetical protein
MLLCTAMALLRLLIRRPRSIQQILKLIEGRRPYRTALTPRHDEARWTVQTRQLGIDERAGQLLR